MAIIIALTGTYAISFGTGLKGGGGGGGGGGTTPPKKPCSEVYKDITRRFLINELRLKYDMSNYSSSSIDNGDMMQLQAAHGEFYQKKGEIRDLMVIVQGNNYVYDDYRKPVCKITVAGTNCTGTITKNYTSIDDVLGNNVKDIPDFGNQLQSMKFEIKTIQTAGHALQLAWTASLDRKQASGYVIVDANAKITCTRSAFYITGPLRDLLPVRQNLSEDGILIYNPLENCVRKVAISDDIQYIVSDEPVNVSPTLQKPIYSGGKFEDAVLWKEPMMLEPMEVTYR